MGYSIYVGEPMVYINTNEDEQDVSIEVDRITLDNDVQLGFGHLQRGSNDWHPSYTSFANFIKEIETVERKLVIDQHPGAMPVTEKLLRQFQQAKVLLEAKYPNIQNGYPLKIKEPEGYNDIPYEEREKLAASMFENHHWTYGKVIWWIFNLEDALRRCKNPVIYNH